MKTYHSVTKRLGFLFFLSYFYAAFSYAGEPFKLISEQEYRAQLPYSISKNKIGRGVRPRSLFGAADQHSPVIVINAPEITRNLPTPITIDIGFQAFDGANIAEKSLKVLYGWLNLDITDRIREHAKISMSGLTAKNVTLPVGEHTITIEISDSKQRTTQKEVMLEVIR